MTAKRSLTRAAAIALATSLLAGASIALRAQTAPRVITLEIEVPVSPPVPASRLTVKEGEPAHFSMKDLGTFDFVPRVKDAKGATVVVTILDASAPPGKELGAVDVPVGGDAVHTKTTPSFGIKVLRVRASK